jgi:predicted Zn-dependent protease
MFKKFKALFLAGSLILTFNGCSKDDDGIECELIPFNAFTVSQDRELGMQVEAQIAAAPIEYPIMPEQGNEAAYAYLRNIRDKILNSGNVKNKDNFEWKLYLIKDDNTLNAFCTPGGYIYVYTGLIKFLDTEDDLAGVIGHEIAHADKRHSSKSMTTQYGVDAVLKIVLGNGDPNLLTQIASQLGTLKYSRCHETEADAASVDYLSGTSYRCNGAATFFEKLKSMGGANTPTFLSTHPSPDNRVEDINKRAADKGCRTTGSTSDPGYQTFKNSL